MAHYILEKGKLTSLQENPFKIERGMQSLIENNLNLLFSLEYVKSEFTLNNLRIDTLAFDKQSNSFVIIEYKQDKRFSVVG